MSRDPRSDNATLREMRKRLRAHTGDPSPGEPDCMYWLKHFDAAAILCGAGTDEGKRLPDVARSKAIRRPANQGCKAVEQIRPHPEWPIRKATKEVKELGLK